MLGGKSGAADDAHLSDWPAHSSRVPHSDGFVVAGCRRESTLGVRGRLKGCEPEETGTCRRQGEMQAGKNPPSCHQHVFPVAVPLHAAHPHGVSPVAKRRVARHPGIPALENTIVTPAVQRSRAPSIKAGNPRRESVRRPHRLLLHLRFVAKPPHRYVAILVAHCQARICPGHRTPFQGQG